MAKLDRVVSAISVACAVIGLLLLTVFAGATVLDGLSRSLISVPLTAVRDLGGLIAAVSVALCMPFAFLRRSHIAVKVVDRAAPRWMRLVLGILSGVISVCLSAAITWQITAYSMKNLDGVTWMLSVPIWPFWLTVAVVMGFASLVQALVVLRDLQNIAQAPTTTR